MGCMLRVQCRPFETNSVLTRASVFFFAGFTLTLYSLFLNPDRKRSRPGIQYFLRKQRKQLSTRFTVLDSQT